MRTTRTMSSRSPAVAIPTEARLRALLRMALSLHQQMLSSRQQPPTNAHDCATSAESKALPTSAKHGNGLRTFHASCTPIAILRRSSARHSPIWELPTIRTSWLQVVGPRAGLLPLDLSIGQVRPRSDQSFPGWTLRAMQMGRRCCKDVEGLMVVLGILKHSLSSFSRLSCTRS